MLEAIISRYPVKVLTPSFLLHGQIEPLGPLLDFLNDTNRASLSFTDVTMYDLAGRLKPSTRQMVVVGKQEICGLYIDDDAGRSSVQLLRRVERVIIHVPNLVCRGEIHLGADTRLPDVFEVLLGQFFALTNASLFPVVRLPADFPQKQDLFLAHKGVVQLYYSDPSHSDEGLT